MPWGAPCAPDLMFILENTIQTYSWGSRTAIANLRGEPAPSRQPQAELWMGTHPRGPSRRATSPRELLSRCVERDPASTLGARVVGAFGVRLPFLLKVLAAAEPLSLQAHPSQQQAEAGYDREHAAGVDADAPERNYRDRNHKPELLCALTGFDALCGFRPVPSSSQLLDALGVPILTRLARLLVQGSPQRGLREAFTQLMQLPPDLRPALVAETAAACQRVAQAGGPFASDCAWIVRLAAKYDGDVGVVSALLLNNVHLEPGEAIFLPAGNLHAYLSGAGVEIMASSDNVLRGGLTNKHVDVTELLRVLDFSAHDPKPSRGVECAPHEIVYEAPAPDFRLSRISVSGRTWSGVTTGPEILLCTSGTATLRGGTELKLGSGQSAFVPAATGTYTVAGSATVFRATVP